MLDPVVNFGKVTVSTGYDDSATSIALNGGDGSKLPDPSTDGNFNLVWWNSTDYGDPADDPNVEIVRVTAVSTDTLTVTRGQEGTSATTKNTGSKTYKMVLSVTKKMIDDLDNRYTLNSDQVSTNVFYRGDAASGSLESDPVWRISRVFMYEDGENIEITFADGNTNFDNIWDNRTILNYPYNFIYTYTSVGIVEDITISVI